MTIAFSHAIAEDGQAVTVHACLRGRSVQSTMHWRTRELADREMAVAIPKMEEELRAQLVVPSLNEREWTRIWSTRIGSVGVHAATGPPTWWKPDLRARRDGRSIEVMGGWLRACVQLYWAPRWGRGGS